MPPSAARTNATAYDTSRVCSRNGISPPMSNQPQQPAVTGTGRTRGHTSASPRCCASASPRENSYPARQTPSITRLCADHGVARQTAAHALHVLQDAGLVYRVPGLGYHVCNDILSRLPRTANVLQLLISRARSKRVLGSSEQENGTLSAWPGHQGAGLRTRSARDAARPFRQAVSSLNVRERAPPMGNPEFGAVAEIAHPDSTRLARR